MCHKTSIAIYFSVLLSLIIVLSSPWAESPQAKEPQTAAKALPEGSVPEPSGILAGKTVWIVDVNSNENFNSALQAAIVDQLSKHTSGMIVRLVKTSERGNPFFLLKRENYPDAAIISVGVCEVTIKKVANYASEAKKKGIPSSTCCLTESRDLQVKWNQKYRNPDAEPIKIKSMPLHPQEAMSIARRVAPVFIEKLEYLFKN